MLCDKYISKVTYSSGVMGNGKVTRLATGLGGSGLLEWRGFAQVLGHQLVDECLIRGFGEHRLFFKNGKDTHGLERKAGRGISFTDVAE